MKNMKNVLIGMLGIGMYGIIFGSAFGSSNGQPRGRHGTIMKHFGRNSQMLRTDTFLQQKHVDENFYVLNKKEMDAIRSDNLGIESGSIVFSPEFHQYYEYNKKDNRFVPLTLDEARDRIEQTADDYEESDFESINNIVYQHLTDDNYNKYQHLFYSNFIDLNAIDTQSYSLLYHILDFCGNDFLKYFAHKKSDSTCIIHPNIKAKINGNALNELLIYAACGDLQKIKNGISAINTPQHSSQLFFTAVGFGRKDIIEFGSRPVSPLKMPQNSCPVSLKRGL